MINEIDYFYDPVSYLQIFFAYLISFLLFDLFSSFIYKSYLSPVLVTNIFFYLVYYHFTFLKLPL